MSWRHQSNRSISHFSKLIYVFRPNLRFPIVEIVIMTWSWFCVRESPGVDSRFWQTYHHTHIIRCCHEAKEDDDTVQTELCIYILLIFPIWSLMSQLFRGDTSSCCFSISRRVINYTWEHEDFDGEIQGIWQERVLRLKALVNNSTLTDIKASNIHH